MSKSVILDKLRQLDMECYAVPVETEDTLVLLCRIQGDPKSPRFTSSQNRLIYCIGKALTAAESPEYKDDDALRLRFSRLWLLKDGDLRYTWDFTFKGDLQKAATLMDSIKVPALSITRTEEVSTQTSVAKRGQVRPVRVGAL